MPDTHTIGCSVDIRKGNPREMFGEWSYLVHMQAPTKNLSPADRATLDAIGVLWNASGGVYPTYAEIALLLNKSRTTVFDACAKLEAKGYLVRLAENDARPFRLWDDPALAAHQAPQDAPCCDAGTEPTDGSERDWSS